jgi:hypothetical protein
MKRNQFIIAALIILVVLVGVAYPLWSPLFINQTVDEAFPFADMTAEEQAAFNALPEDQQAAIIAMQDENADMAAETAKSVIMPDNTMNEDMPTEPVTVASGDFVEIDAVHKGEGKATIYTLPEGNSVVRFEDFRVTNGPDLHVLLAKAEAPRTREDLGEDYIELGSLKGNVGNQNYDIPADTDLSAYNSIVIYCMPFHVVFSTATLTASP